MLRHKRGYYTQTDSTRRRYLQQYTDHFCFSIPMQKVFRLLCLHIPRFPLPRVSNYIFAVLAQVSHWVRTQDFSAPWQSWQHLWRSRVSKWMVGVVLSLLYSCKCFEIKFFGNFFPLQPLCFPDWQTGSQTDSVLCFYCAHFRIYAIQLMTFGWDK